MTSLALHGYVCRIRSHSARVSRTAVSSVASYLPSSPSTIPTTPSIRPHISDRLQQNQHCRSCYHPLNNKLHTSVASTINHPRNNHDRTIRRAHDEIDDDKEFLTTVLTRLELARSPQCLLDAFARLDRLCKEDSVSQSTIDANLLECLLQAWSRTLFVLKLALEVRHRNDEDVFSRQNLQRWSGPDLPLFNVSFDSYYQWLFHQEYKMALPVAAEWREAFQSESDFDGSSVVAFLQQLDCATVLQKVHLYTEKGLVPNTTDIFNVILQTLSKMDQQEEAMNQLYSWMEGQVDAKPNQQTALSMMQVYANTNHPKACQAFFQRNLHLMELEHVRLVIQAWQSNAVEIKDFYDWLVQNSDLELDTYTKNKILEKWASLPFQQQKPPIDQLLVQLIPSPKDRDLFSYSTLFRGLYNVRANVERAEPFYQEMLDQEMTLSKWHYINLIQLYSESRKCEEMEQLYRDFRNNITATAVPDRVYRAIFKSRLRAWSSVGNPDMCQQVLDEMAAFGFPVDVIGYNRVLTAWLNANHPNASEKIESLIMRMEQLSEEENMACKPNTISYNIWIAALTKSNTLIGAQQAEECFEEMRMNHVDPNVVTYSTLIDCWINLKMYDRVQYLYELGKRSLAKKHGNKQAHVIHRMALKAWERAGDGRRAEDVLNEMMNLYESGELAQPPDTMDFTMALGAWNRSRVIDSGEQGESLLRRMVSYAKEKRFPCFPNKYSYAQCILAWSSSSVPDAGERALALLDELKFLSQSSRRNGNTDSNPDFGHYSMTIVALTKSLMYKPDPKETEHKIRELIDELRGQETSFWMHNRQSITTRFERVRDCLEKSEIGNKDAFLVEWKNLEDTIIRSLPKG